MTSDDDTELDEPLERDEGDDDDDGEMTWNEYIYVPKLERDAKRMERRSERRTKRMALPYH